MGYIKQPSPGNSSGELEGHLNHFSEFLEGAEVEVEEEALAREPTSPQLFGPHSPPPPPEPMAIALVETDRWEDMQETRPDKVNNSVFNHNKHTLGKA